MQATLSHYRILEQIGVGGMGVVYRAHDEHLDCDVALKVLPEGKLAEDAARKSFRKEALALSKIHHPNIAVVHDFDTQDGTDFLVEELIPGLSLNEMLLSGPLPEQEIVNLGWQLCEGLAAAHEQDVIHGDLKPGNIRVTPDARLKILDFGLAKVPHTAAPASNTAPTVTLTGTTMGGTLPYMAPEQLLNQKLDPRIDIWSAGCVFYEMATGRRPFLGYGPALIDTILHQQPAVPSMLNPKLSAGLEAIILKCLEKDPALRYTSACDIAVDFHRLTASSSTIRAVQQPPRVRTRNIIIGSACLALLVVAVIFGSRLVPRPSASLALQSAEVPRSIAVLPFADLSPHQDQEYFSDGLAEELITNLAKIPQLQVTARTSSFQFKGKNEDLRVIGGKLNVATVLEGGVRKQGNRVRITAQLINVSDGFHLWSEAYDRNLTDIFAVQEEIAGAVTTSLKVTLLGDRASTPRATSIEAYNAYLQGKYFVAQSRIQPQREEVWDKAIAYYEESIKLDPTYARAWAGLSVVHLSRAIDSPDLLHREKSLNKAREAAERALALDPNLADAYAAMGRIKHYYDWDWAGADACFQRALALEPGNASILLRSSWLALTLGHLQRALRLSRQAVELDPLQEEPYYVLAWSAQRAGRLDEATAANQKQSELNPNAVFQHVLRSYLYLAQSRPQEALIEAEDETNPGFRLQGLALAYHALARKQESDRALAELIAKYRQVDSFQIAEVYAFRGDRDAAFQWLERAYLQRDGGLAFIKGDWLLKDLVHDPRYAAFLRKMRLPV